MVAGTVEKRITALLGFLRGGDKRYHYGSDDERLCARYGHELHKRFVTAAAHPGWPDPERWGEIHRAAVRAAREAVPQPREGRRHAEIPGQLTNGEWTPKEAE